MSFTSLVAKRFLTGRKKNGFLSFIALFSLFGVCLGVAALTVVMGVMEGFESQLRSIITGTHSHLVVYSQRNAISDPEELEERMRRIAGDQIEALSPYVFSQVMLAKGARVQGSMVEGIGRDLNQVTNIETYVSEGRLPDYAPPGEAPELLLGKAIAEALNAKVGDEVTVISPFFEKENLQPRSRRFKVVGLFNTGMHEYDSKYGMMQIQEARDFFRLGPGAASAFKVKTKNADTSGPVARLLERELGSPYRARDWSELNRNLFYAVRLQKAVIFVVLTAIILVAAFNIMSTLMMIMSEKKKEMSILKAMGLSPRRSASVFLRVGLLIGLSGAAAGVCLGLFLSLILSKTQFVQLPPDVYFISYLPVDVRPATLALIAGCALVVALLATVYPSYRMAVESPVEGLRYE